MSSATTPIAVVALAVCFSGVAGLRAQDVARAEPVAPSVLPGEAVNKPELKAGWKTEKEARTFTLSIPAPRGQITDRHGVPLAQCRVVQYLALSFPFLGDKATDAEVLDFAAKRVMEANRVLRKTWNMPQDRVIQHYRNRRWLPLVFSISDNINEEITPEQQVKLKPLLGPNSGLVLQPAYLRVYPKGNFAGHIIGYTHKTRPLPTGPIQDGDSLFDEQEGLEGLEKSFDRDLQGKAGQVNVLFNPDGTKVKEEVLRRPVPGANVVTTIDASYQKITEDALAKHTASGSMVIIEVKTGEIVAMASYPSFDPNVWIPGIRSQDFKRLMADKMAPMHPRAFQAEYPPASTFKMIVALAGLEAGTITPRTSFDCSSSLTIGDHVFHNHVKDDEGPMNVVSALKRSCNTWFYQAGLATGAVKITNMAQRLGFGERVGIPLAERPGLVPTDSFMQQRYGHKNLSGDIANLSIGQGRTQVTPLQAAQAMVAVADGNNLPEVHLVRQIQDLNDRVLQVFAPATRRRVDISPAARETVLKGMIAVVSAAGGTGHAAELDAKYHCQIAGKTGTAQWLEKEDRGLAWFTGFLPANDPVYAFAVVYEGRPGQRVHGGTEAAPIVHQVFENILKSGQEDEPLVMLAKNSDAPKAIPVSEDDEKGDAPAETVEKAKPAEGTPITEPPPEEQKRGGIGGFFRRIFGR